MKVSQVMSTPVIRIHDREPVSVAARTLTHYNIGALPVCTADGRVCGVITDRDIVTRCLAAGRVPEETLVREVMTAQVLSASPDMDADSAARLMGQKQVRRLPVLEQGKLCGMLSLADLATQSSAAHALEEISGNISRG